MHETAFAKLNLALHVRARQEDGYHRIETLFAFVEAGDTLAVRPARALSLDVRGPFAEAAGPVASNLVLRAAAALQQIHGLSAGAALTLDKLLPVAAGLGGGSADAAAALRLLTRFWALPEDEEKVRQLAQGLGADVPACLVSRLARGEGIGAVLTPVDDRSLHGLPVLLVNPGVALATSAVFAAWDRVDRGPLGPGPALEAAQDGRNDLEAAACSIVPEIRLVLAALSGCDGNLLVRMSGSGATCFALFESTSARDSGAKRIGVDHPSWWQLASCLRGPCGPG
jgi:4-diphosphocytidyl-2-C-methyl-D-erythritol kinase